MGMTPRKVEREPTGQRNVTTPHLAGPAMASAVPLPYMGDDELFRDPFRDGLPSSR